ncbi:unnamed protein product [Phaeothamnion confervicola]
MKCEAAVLCALVAGASAFTGTPLVGVAKTAARGSSQVSMMAKSASVPFMARPKALDGTVPGDAGFDPLGFSDWIDLKFLREAEIKHGRICMLAWLGYVATDLGVHLPGDMHALSSLEAHDAAVKFGAMPQILLFISAFEAVSTPAVVQMVNGSGREPGYFGFDPLGFAKTDAKMVSGRR